MECKSRLTQAPGLLLEVTSGQTRALVNKDLHRRKLFAYPRPKRAMGDSVQVAPLAAGRRGWFFFGVPWWQGAGILLLIAWLYGSILGRLFAHWINDPNFSHVIFLAGFSLFVLS